MTSAPAWGFRGRDTQCAAITEHLDRGGCAVIAGDAGVGKTRLAREVLAMSAAVAGRTTRWVTASVATSTVPLGALAHLLPTTESGRGDRQEPMELLQAAASCLAESRCGHRPVVAIDDAHLLDDLSLALVRQVALTGSIALVLTMRTGAPTPDGMVELGKDDLVTRFDLDPLNRADTEALVQESLGGLVETRSLQRIWEASRGNPLYLRELLDAGRETEALRCTDGVWQFAGLSLTSRLIEVVGARARGLDPAQREALEIIATAEPVRLDRLPELVTPQTWIALQRRRLITVERDGEDTVIAIAHPVHAEALRALTPPAVRSRISRWLLDEGARESVRPAHRVRAALLALECGEPIGHGMLTDVAQAASTTLDLDSAERLARAAIAAGAGFGAHAALLDVLTGQGRGVDATAAAATAETLAQTEREHAQVARLRAHAWIGDRATAPQAVWPGAGEAAGATELDGAQGLMAFYRGDPPGAAALARQALHTHPDSGGSTAAWAALAAAAAVAGRSGEAIAAVREGWSAMARITGPTTVGPITDGAVTGLALATAELLALSLTGRFGELELRAGELHAAALAGPAWAGDAVAALHRGAAALAVGRVSAAISWLSEAHVGLRAGDPSGTAQLCVAQLATAYAQLGDADTPARLLDTLDPDQDAVPVFEPHVLLARAWQSAAEGRPRAAAEAALCAATVSAEQQQWAMEARALHTAVRFGAPGPVCQRLVELSGLVEGELVPIYAAHAAAAATQDAHQLATAAHRFDAVGAPLLAAEAAAHAATALARDGHRGQAVVLAATCDRWARYCGPVWTPALAAIPRPRLSTRESEVAALARAGLRNRVIADRLVVSVRTVEAHLANVYRKLGIHFRHELRDHTYLDRHLH